MPLRAESPRTHRATVAHDAERRLAMLEALESLDEALVGRRGAAALLTAVGAAVGAPVALHAGRPHTGSSCAPVTGPGVPLRWLVAEQVLDAERRDVLEQAAALLSLRLVRDERVRAIRHSHAAAAVGDLVAGVAARALACARALGIDLAPLATVAFVVDGDVDAVARAVPEGLAAPLLDGVVVIASRDCADLRLRLAAGGGGVGVAHADGPAGIEAAVAAARRASRRPAPGRAAGEAVDADVASFASSLLRPLIEHDRTRGSDLVGTLGVYLRAGGSIAEAARRLDVHVNTLRHRLVRVRELGIELAEPRTRFGLDLALRMRAGPLSGSPERAVPRSADSTVGALAGRL